MRARRRRPRGAARGSTGPGARAVASSRTPTTRRASSSTARELVRCWKACPSGVAVLLDEALVEFADAQPTSMSIELLEQSPRLLVFRSFSKAWGLAGPARRLRRRRPRLRAAAGRARPRPGRLRALAGRRARGDPQLPAADRSTGAPIHDERHALDAALRERGFDVTESQANFLWAAHPTRSSAPRSRRAWRSRASRRRR